VEQPQVEENRVETTTQAETSREVKKRTREFKKLVQDVRENVGAPSNKCRKRRSPYQYTSYMALITKLVDTDPSFFEEAIEKPIWVDAMVEEYKSIVKNSVWEVVPRPTDKSILGSRWIFKVKHAADRSIEKY